MVTGVWTRLATGIRARVATGIRAGVATRIRAGVATRIRAGVATRVRAGVATGIRAGVATRIRAGGRYQDPGRGRYRDPAGVATRITPNVVAVGERLGCLAVTYRENNQGSNQEKRCDEANEPGHFNHLHTVCRCGQRKTVIHEAQANRSTKRSKRS